MALLCPLLGLLLVKQNGNQKLHIIVITLPLQLDTYRLVVPTELVELDQVVQHMSHVFLMIIIIVENGNVGMQIMVPP